MLCSSGLDYTNHSRRRRRVCWMGKGAGGLRSDTFTCLPTPVLSCSLVTAGNKGHAGTRSWRSGVGTTCDSPERPPETSDERHPTRRWLLSWGGRLYASHLARSSNGSHAL